MSSLPVSAISSPPASKVVDPVQATTFMHNTIILCDLVIETVKWAQGEGFQTTLSPFLLQVGRGILSTKDPSTMIAGFIERSYSYWSSILSKDQKFLIDNAKILFAELPEDHVKAFSVLFASKNPDGSFVIPQETRDSVWEILHAMVTNCIRHIHLSRCPDKVTKRYTMDYFPNISVKGCVTAWHVSL